MPQVLLLPDIDWSMRDLYHSDIGRTTRASSSLWIDLLIPYPSIAEYTRVYTYLTPIFFFSFLKQHVDTRCSKVENSIFTESIKFFTYTDN